MSIAKTFAAALALAVLGLTGCGGGGVEGTYKLDKTEMKKAMEAKVAEMPADQQGFAKLAVALIDAMDISVELQPGGKVIMKSTMPSLDGKDKPAQTKETTGTWKKDGENIILDDGDGKPAKCKVSPNKLNCEAEKPGEPGLVLVKG